MHPWQFRAASGELCRVGFGYARHQESRTPHTTLAWLYQQGEDGRWQRLPWQGAASLHPKDEGKFSYAEGRKLAVRRLIQAVPFALKPLVAQAFFGKSA